MFAVGMDKIEGLILYSQLNIKYKIDITGNNSIINKKDNTDTYFNLDETKEIIFGCLLGDGSLELPPRGLNARFGFIQSESKRDYFLSVLNSLSFISSGKFREYSHLDKRTNKTYKNLNFWSKALPLLTEFYTSFYKNKVKIVPSDLSLLTPLALSHWVAQDGSRGSSKGLYLCTDSFTYKDVKRLTQYLIETYNLKCSIHKAGRNYRIYILAKSVNAVKTLVLPFMHNSMLYKLGI